MPIVPLPVMQEEEEERRRNGRPSEDGPRTVVVRYGYMRQIAELRIDEDEQIGCGTKMVIRTSRGIELATMLTTVCANAGCGHSVTRKQMLQYVEASGGKNYPFTSQGRVLRVATSEDIIEQDRLDGRKKEIGKFAKELIREMDLPMKLVDVELLLGGERIIFHYTSEQWVDFRELVKRLASEYQTRIEMHQVNARDEARLVADYEKCGQHCCCKQFLKVLKPVSMKAAKIQKATLDPSKISGRCGRLMCCLRYEEKTYDELRKRLPHKQTRVMTEDGIGTIIDSQILTQLVLVRLDRTGAPAAYALENVTKLSKEEEAKILEEQREAAAKEAERARSEGYGRQGGRRSGRRRDREDKADKAASDAGKAGGASDTSGEDEGGAAKKRRRRRRRPRGGKGEGPSGPGDGQSAGEGDQGSVGYKGAGSDGQSSDAAPGDGASKKKRRRRRRRRGRGGGSGGGDGDGGGGGDSA